MQANVQDVIEALLPLVSTLEQLGIPYYVGGSVASFYYGLFRQTQDVDVILAVRPQDIRPLAKVLGQDYSIDEDACNVVIVR